MKNVWGYPYLKTHIFFLLKICPILFQILNVNMYMMLWYVVFEYLMKRKGKEKVGYFFHQIKISPPKKDAYQPMNMNPYLSFRKAVTFKSLFFSIIQMLYKELK